jgi:hypothetical protein
MQSGKNMVLSRGAVVGVEKKTQHKMRNQLLMGQAAKQFLPASCKGCTCCLIPKCTLYVSYITIFAFDIINGQSYTFIKWTIWSY